METPTQPQHIAETSAAVGAWVQTKRKEEQTEVAVERRGENSWEVQVKKEDPPSTVEE